MVEIHTIISIKTIDVRYALLELTPRLYALLHGHVAHAIPPLCDVFGTVTLLNQALYQVALVCGLTALELLYILLMIQLPEHVILFAH